MKNKFAIVIVVLIFFVVVVPFAILLLINRQNQQPEQIFCTMEAKMCPDGSYVGRSGPKCEFAKCPETTDTVKINQRILNNGIYITPIKVISDSRCPKDVQCIWAGTVSLKVKLEKESRVQELDLELGKPITFAGQLVTLIKVSPSTTANEVIKDTEYSFVFTVK